MIVELLPVYIADGLIGIGIVACIYIAYYIVLNIGFPPGDY